MYKTIYRKYGVSDVCEVSGAGKYDFRMIVPETLVAPYTGSISVFLPHFSHVCYDYLLLFPNL